MSVKDNIEQVRKRVEKAALSANRDPNEISIVAVSKNIAPSKILKAIDAGITIVGENRVQELIKKYDIINKNISWHMIGSLQTNKVKYIIDKVDLIHSLDRISLARELNKRAGAIGRKIQTLIQVNMSRESTKSGIYEEDLISFIEELVDYPNIEVKGLMTIGPNTHDTDTVRECFSRFRCLFEDLRSRQIDHIDMQYLSMGMTNDYEIAIEEGSNMIRIGRGIFMDK